MMATVTTTQWLVLNATADDFEDLERIYQSICLQFSSEKYAPSKRESFYLREAADAVPLAEIIEAIRSLIDLGLLSVRFPGDDTVAGAGNDLSYLWRGWFGITDRGRAALISSSPK
jgi:hypothetical protein